MPAPHSALFRLAGIAALMVTALGCPSPSGPDSDSGEPGPLVKGPPVKPVAVEHTVRPVDPPVVPVEPPIPPVEPDALPNVPADPPTDPPAAAETVDPHPPLADNVGGTLNPLRGSGQPDIQEPPPKDSPPAEVPVNTNPKVTGKGQGEKEFDPVKENGPIFVGWPEQVKLALIITGRQEGYIEPCGCAGLDRMKGGMSRRHTLFRQLRAKGWPVVGVDVGGLAKGYGRQAVLKFHTMAEGMRKMGYSAIALGTTDLQLPTGELAAEAASVDGQPSSFISANAAMFGFMAKMTAQARIVEQGGMKLGITAVIGKEFQKQLEGNNTIELADPEPALSAVVSHLSDQVDYLILLAHATMDESTELARKFPQIDLVVTAGGGSTPPATPAKVPGSETLLIEVGEKGMDVVVLALFDDPKHPYRYQRVPLDSRFPASADMSLLMSVYQDQLKREWASRFAVGKVPHPQAEMGGKFVGSEECKSCHEASYDIWKKSGHAKAHHTLVELNPPRIYDPECISCHVIGWHPEEHFPYKGSYVTKDETPQLVDVGCENCHGPGGAHVAAEQGADLALQERLQAALVITKEESQKRQCRTCHDLDNSPDFDFETYWPKVEHYEDVKEEGLAGGGG